MSRIVTEVFVVSAYIGSQHLHAHTQQLVIHYYLLIWNGSNRNIFK